MGGRPQYTPREVYPVHTQGGISLGYPPWEAYHPSIPTMGGIYTVIHTLRGIYTVIHPGIHHPMYHPGYTPRYTSHTPGYTPRYTSHTPGLTSQTLRYTGC